MERISRTRSICPVCGRQLPAERLQEADRVYLRRTCPEHGEFSALIWRGPVDYREWQGGSLDYREETACPKNCGICPDHRQGTCCVLYEVTNRCDLACRFCFAEGGGGEDVPLARVKLDLQRIGELASPGKPLLQLSGGEPTVRDDLPEIIAFAKGLGFPYIQLNTNGLRLAEDEAYLRACAAAGLSFVFLQFDGTRDEIYRTLRGKPLLAQKQAAIAACGRARLGVTLVPTLVPGVNTDNIGDMVRFGVAQSPTVRGVHFQPVSYFGRFPRTPAEADRYTLGDLLGDLTTQCPELVSLDDLVPSHCDHPLCGFHGSFIAEPDGSLTALSRPVEGRTAAISGGAGSETPLPRRPFRRRTRWAPFCRRPRNGPSP